MRNTLLTTTYLIALMGGLLVSGEGLAGQGTGTRMKGLPGRVFFHGDNLGSRTQRATLVGFSQKQNVTIRFAAHPGGVNKVFANCTATQHIERDGHQIYYCSVETVIPSWAWEEPGERVRHCAAGQFFVNLSGHFTQIKNSQVYRYDDPEVSCRICERDPEIQGCTGWVIRVDCSEPGTTTLCADD